MSHIPTDCGARVAGAQLLQDGKHVKYSDFMPEEAAEGKGWQDEDEIKTHVLIWGMTEVSI